LVLVIDWRCAGRPRIGSLTRWSESEETIYCFLSIASVIGVACVGARYLLVTLDGNVWGYMVK